MVLSNIDTLIFTLNIENYNESTDYALSRIAEKQNIAKETSSNQYITFDTLSFKHEDFVTFEVLPNGSRQHKFILHNNFFEIKLANYYNPKASNLPVYVKLKSEFLWLYSKDAYYKCIDVIEEIFGKVNEVKMSRVDLCCHTDLIKMQDLHIDQFVSRAKKHSEIFGNKQLETMSFGESPVMARIYDKLKEVNQSGKKKWFFTIWHNHGAECDNVVNIEFELKRDILKQFGINTYEELLTEIKSIWIYLTKDWLIRKKDDKSRIEDCTIDDNWLEVHNAFNEWQGVKGVTRDRQKKANEQHLLNMITGYMLSHAGAKQITDFEEYMKSLISDVFVHLTNRDIHFHDEVMKRIQMG